MKVCITGGSGTLGQELAQQLYGKADKIVIFSRSESLQAEMRSKFPEGPPGPTRYRIGDVRDFDRLKSAMHDCDTVIHAAAMKRIDTCETEVYECLKTNIEGTANVARACNELGIKQAMFVSTDKACDPISAYGCAKAFSEHLWIQSNNYGTCNFAAIRYGNVAGSKGSVHAMWEKMRGQELKITHPEMTRFFWSIQEAAKFLLACMATQERGVIYIPKMKSYRMIDIAKEYSDKIKIGGLRCSEKIHEELISETDISSGFARDNGTHYSIYPIHHAWQKTLTMYGKEIKDWEYITSKVKGLPDLAHYDLADVDIKEILNVVQ
jgi:UDP-N-acetylglucosamine 4,6-dehydratase